MSDKDKRVIPDGAHHSGLMKDYGGQYNPDYVSPQAAELTRLREREAVLVEALETLMGHWRAFNDPEWGNQEKAYYCLAKGAQESWKKARKALAARKPASDEIGE